MGGFVGDFMEHATPYCQGPVTMAPERHELMARFLVSAFALAFSSPARPDSTAPGDALDQYVGVYELPSGKGITIQRDGPKLTMRLDEGAPVDIIPKRPTEFVAKGTNTRIRFEQDEHGQTTALELRRAPLDETASRLDDAGAASLNAAVAARRTRFQSQTPDPSSEAAVRDLITGITSGKPNYGAMTPTTAAGIRQLLPRLQAIFVFLGPVSSIRFLRVDKDGVDVYEARHLRGKTKFEILISPEGLITANAHGCPFSHPTC